MAYEHEEKRRKKARSVLNGSGYRAGGHVTEKEVKADIDKAVHKHEKHDHPGAKETKLKTGGCADGYAAGGRLDKFKRGGRTKAAKTKINIIVGQPKDNSQDAHMAGMMQGAAMAKAGAPRPPMAPPPGMPPAGAGPIPGGPGVPPVPGGAPGMPPMKRGGRATMTAGAGSGEGREEKAEMQKRARR